MNNILNNFLVFIILCLSLAGCKNDTNERSTPAAVYTKWYNPFVDFDSIVSFQEWRIGDNILQIEWVGLNKDTNIVLTSESNLDRSYIRLVSLSKTTHSNSGVMDIIKTSYEDEYHVSIEGEDTIYHKGEYLYKFENGLLNSEEFSYYLNNRDSLNGL
ncbi:MAG: hypothetical protein GQ574_29145 [Crocinitomix sp.]|nr:hypothetical protein [Crocinitomix sp.]